MKSKSITIGIFLSVALVVTAAWLYWMASSNTGSSMARFPLEAYTSVVRQLLNTPVSPVSPVSAGARTEAGVR